MQTDPARERISPGRPEIDYAERLWVPVTWWLLGTGFALSLGIAMIFYLGPWWAVGSLVVTEAVIAAFFLGYSARIVVSERGLQVGRAQIEWRYLDGAEVLDADQIRSLLREQADVRAFLAIRPYLRTGVRVRLADPADPHPYWLVSSRYADRLAQRMAARLGRSAAAQPDTGLG